MTRKSVRTASKELFEPIAVHGKLYNVQTMLLEQKSRVIDQELVKNGWKEWSRLFDAAIHSVEGRP